MNPPHITKRKVDITTAIVVLLTGLSMIPYELEKIPVPPSVKPWLTLVGVLATPMLLAIRNQFPPVNRPPESPPSDPPPSS